MGLDMYLNAEKYLGVWSLDPDVKDKDWAYRNILKLAGFPDYLCDNEDGRSLEVQVQIAYWRKANEIHNWFVQNVQDGKDECQHSYVERDKLIALRDLCADLLKRKSAVEAAKKLPTQSGFFFGSTKIDEGYWQDLDYTVRTLTRALDSKELQDASFYYHSSW